MRTMLVSEFKARCLATLKEVHRTREPLLVTLRGQPLVLVEPPSRRRGKRLGRLKGRMAVHCDLVRLDSRRDWEVLR